MSEITTPAATKTTAPKTDRQARLQRAAAKVNKSTGPKKFHGVDCPNGKFWNEKRIAIVKALRALGASSATAARPAADIVKKGKEIEPHNVTRYCHDNEPLVKGGIVKKANHEDQSSTCYYLSAVGMKCGFDY